jgi:hypothetical protein
VRNLLPYPAGGLSGPSGAVGQDDGAGRDARGVGSAGLWVTLRSLGLCALPAVNSAREWGAKRGANVDRRQATSGDDEPLFPQVAAHQAAPSHIQRRGVCA